MITRPLSSSAAWTIAWMMPLLGRLGDLPATAPELAQPTQLSPITGPRDLLRRHGIEDRFFDNLHDRTPLTADDQRTLLKILYWFREFRPLDVQRWARPSGSTAFLNSPASSRGDIFHLAGRVTRVEVCPLTPEMAEQFGLKHYYRCELMQDSQAPALLFASEVPQAWPIGRPIDESAAAYGLFLKLAQTQQDRLPTPVFVARRIAWYPNTPLGRLGMDVGLLDEVRNRQALTTGDQECFYQLLAAVGRTKPGQLLQETDRRLQRGGKTDDSVVPLFNEAQKQTGRLVALSGTVRRAIPVYVTDPEIKQRFGIDHYYQVALVTSDSQSNPLFFCVRELPPQMPLGEGPEYAESVRVAGFFLKTWGYDIQVPDTALDPAHRPKGRQQQLAPLLIGRDLVWYPRQEAAPDRFVQAIGGAAVALAILGVWLTLWWFRRRDHQFQAFQQRRSAAIHGPDVSTDLANIEVDPYNCPDSPRASPSHPEENLQ